ncbi:hypothetical protein [Candidatus Vidania fulgoroideorum]
MKFTLYNLFSSKRLYEFNKFRKLSFLCSSIVNKLHIRNFFKNTSNWIITKVNVIKRKNTKLFIVSFYDKA